MAQERLSSTAIIAKELKVKQSQVENTIALLDGGATVPFIARYRKEATEGLDDVQLRFLSDRLIELRDLDTRREVILESIRKQDKLTPELETLLQEADSKARLEDLYQPYKPKRHSKAQQAIEAGLEPLALALWQDPSLVPEEEAQRYVDPEKGITEIKAALEGARQILMERFSEDAALLHELREQLWQHALLKSVARSKVQKELNKFSDYLDFSQPIKKIPSHRALALFRGRRESVLQLTLVLPEANINDGETRLKQQFQLSDEKRPADAWLAETGRLTWKIKILPKLELELFSRLREMADEEAIKVFSKNLRDLLLAAPAGPRVTIGLDPGLRTGVKLVVIDATGKLLDYSVLFPFAPQNEWHQSVADLAKLIVKYEVSLLSIGNGTGSRETERLVSDLMKMYPDLQLTKVLVSEAGASVYSASELASQEFPDLDVTLRGAVSIARRIQDPLAELVKIDAKSIGVGQYQHDVNQPRLARCLDAVVEDCVNAVGVDVNTASAPLLTRISGLNEGLAKNIVAYRDEHGAFKSREQLKAVQRMGDKSFQQAAGFLRIRNGDNPLDASCVHPEAYPLVERIMADKQTALELLMGNREMLSSINASEYLSADYGLPTIQDVLKELEKPGRDPRPEFKTAQFKEGIEALKDLNMGMILEGVVSNVTNFGAFVDIGVHQDGLVHISEMAQRFVRDPHSLMKAGDVVQVKVIEVDLERKRIGLSMKLSEVALAAPKAQVVTESKPQRKPKKPEFKKETAVTPMPKKAVFNTAMADALSRLKMKITE